MCIIIVNEKGIIKDEYLENSFDGNSDGAGLAWSEDGQVQSFKTMKKDEFIDSYKKLKERGVEKVLIHCRIKTHGSVGINNAHPFPVHSNLMLMHNGVINLKYYYAELGYKDMEEKEFEKLDLSDTAMFAKYLTQCFPKNIIKSGSALSVINKLIGDTYNKLAFIDNLGNTAIVNEKLGKRDDGNWYSNDSYKAKKVKYEYSKNYTKYYCDYCRVYVSGGASKYCGFNYCDEHYKMALHGEKGKCYSCNEKCATYIIYEGIHMCVSCNEKKEPKKLKEISPNCCEGCGYYAKCEKIENTWLCYVCSYSADIPKDTKSKAWCRGCDSSKEECIQWNGIWFCGDCSKVAEAKKYKYGWRKCAQCKESASINHLIVKDKAICVNCIEGSENFDEQSLCWSCKQLTLTYQERLCGDCGLIKERQELQKS